MNREEAARVLSSMRDTLKKVYLVAIDEERISALEAAVGYLLAEDNNAPTRQPDPSTGYSHTHRLYSQSPEVICPKCGKPMYKTGSFAAGVIQCDIHRWKCDDCGIQREQAYDWPFFQPREWHRPRYSIKGGEWIGEDEPKKLKAAIDALPPLPKVDTPLPEEEKKCDLWTKD